MSLANSVNQSPTKVLYCIDQLVRGGTELQLIGLIDRLDRELYSPYLLTIRPTAPELIPDQCHHIPLDVPKLLSPAGFRAFWWLRRYLRQEGIDVVQTFFQDSTVFAGLAAWCAQTPARIACFRDLAFWKSSKQTLLLKRVYPLMHAYLCNSGVVLDHFVNHFGIDRQRAYIVRNGIDASQLPYKQHPGETLNIGIVGNMTRAVKRTDLFIHAAALVYRQHPEVMWHIVGDGQLRPELERLAEELGVRHRLTFTGRIDDVTGYLERLQVGVICSDSEGLSNALLEYMFRGVAAVVTEVGGNTELVEGGVTGITVPPDDPDALAAAITELIDQPQLRRSMAESARERVEQSYSWELCLAEHYGIYKGLLASRAMEQSA